MFALIKQTEENLRKFSSKIFTDRADQCAMWLRRLELGDSIDEAEVTDACEEFNRMCGK